MYGTANEWKLIFINSRIHNLVAFELIFNTIIWLMFVNVEENEKRMI